MSAVRRAAGRGSAGLGHPGQKPPAQQVKGADRGPLPDLFAPAGAVQLDRLRRSGPQRESYPDGADRLTILFGGTGDAGDAEADVGAEDTSERRRPSAWPPSWLTTGRR